MGDSLLVPAGAGMVKRAHKSRPPPPTPFRLGGEIAYGLPSGSASAIEVERSRAGENCERKEAGVAKRQRFKRVGTSRFCRLPRHRSDLLLHERSLSFGNGTMGKGGKDDKNFLM